MTFSVESEERVNALTKTRSRLSFIKWTTFHWIVYSESVISDPEGNQIEITI